MNARKGGLNAQRGRMMEQRPAAAHDRDDRHRRVMESVWRWKLSQHAPVVQPVRRFSRAVLRDAAIGLAIAAVLYAANRPVIAAVAAAVSVAVLVVRAILPASLSAPLVAFSGRVVLRIGHALTAIVLGIVYFTVFVLLRAWRGLTGHDALRRQRIAAGQSFWIDRSSLPETSPEKPY
jgi:large-conductance mechanosensitive channel